MIRLLLTIEIYIAGVKIGLASPLRLDIVSIARRHGRFFCVTLPSKGGMYMQIFGNLGLKHVNVCFSGHVLFLFTFVSAIINNAHLATINRKTPPMYKLPQPRI